MDKHRFSLPDIVFFLNTDPKLTIERMGKRGHDMEVGRMGKRGRDMEVEYKDILHYQECLLESYHTILPQYNIQLHYCDTHSITGRLNELEKLL